MAKVFTKKQLIMEVAKATDLPQTKVAEVFETASSVQRKQLKAGCAVKTENGQIKIVTRKARRGVDPRNGKRITIPAAKKPKFIFSEKFRRNFK